MRGIFVVALAVAACGGRADTDVPAQVTADAGSADEGAPDAGPGSCCLVDGSAYCEPAYALVVDVNPVASQTRPCAASQACAVYTPMPGVPGVWNMTGAGTCENP
jgi:hypothetical protein